MCCTIGPGSVKRRVRGFLPVDESAYEIILKRMCLKLQEGAGIKMRKPISVKILLWYVSFTVVFSPRNKTPSKLVTTAF